MNVCCQPDSLCPGAGPSRLERPWGVVGLHQVGAPCGGWRWQALGMQQEDLVLKAGGKAKLGLTSSPMSSGRLRMALEGDFTATALTRGTSEGSAQPSHGFASDESRVHPRLLPPKPLGQTSTWSPVVKWEIMHV